MFGLLLLQIYCFFSIQRPTPHEFMAFFTKNHHKWVASLPSQVNIRPTLTLLYVDFATTLTSSKHF